MFDEPFRHPVPQNPRKAAQFARARKLRRAGSSIKRIAAEVDVSPSSVLRWTQDIELTPDQVASLAEGQIEAGRAAGKTWSDLCRERRRRWQAIGRAQARLADPLHAAGCMLYRAEGAKQRNSLTFANSDPGIRRKNKLPYGVCTVQVCSTELVQHVFGAIQEYSGFDNPAWLD